MPENQDTPPANQGADGRDPKGRFVKGTSGNPKGRPKRSAVLSDCLWTELHKPATLADGSEGTRAQRLAEALVDAACAGNVRAMGLTFERLEGRAPTLHTEADADRPPTIVRFVLHKEPDDDADDDAADADAPAADPPPVSEEPVA